MAKFKVGDEVICVESDKTKGDGWKKDYRFTIESISNEHDGNPIYWKGLNGSGVYEGALELAKPKKPINPTHLVVWDEKDQDPCQFFESGDEARDFIKELSEKPHVIKDSIILVEIKSAKKVVIQKSLRYTKNHTI